MIPIEDMPLATDSDADSIANEIIDEDEDYEKSTPSNADDFIHDEDEPYQDSDDDEDDDEPRNIPVKSVTPAIPSASPEDTTQPEEDPDPKKDENPDANNPETVGDLYGQPIGGYNDSALNDSYFKEPWAVAPFLDGYAVSDSANNVVRFIAHDRNKVQTATGQRAKGSLNGYGIGATFNRPTGLATDEAGNLYIADTGNNRIRKLTNTGTITTYLENLNEPTGLCWKNGSLYICESGANRILRAENGSVTVVAGSGGEALADGSAEQAQFHDPQGVTVADDGIIYVSDTGNNAVRKIQNGVVSTIAVCDQNAMDPSPVAPVGLMVKGDRLYVCDNFSRAVLTYPR